MDNHFSVRLRELLAGQPQRKFQQGLRGRYDDPAYNCWKKMRARCNNPRDDHYVYYGARGIRVCPQWDDFFVFIKDIGPRPSLQHTIERIDNNGNYEPGNVRWATMAEQNANRRHPAKP